MHLLVVAAVSGCLAGIGRRHFDRFDSTYLIWEAFRLAKYSAIAHDNSASEAATWQLHRQGLAEYD